MKFMYRLKGNAYAYGPIEAPDMATAIKKIKKLWECRRKDFEVWESDGNIGNTPEEQGILTNHWAGGPI